MHFATAFACAHELNCCNAQASSAMFHVHAAWHLHVTMSSGTHHVQPLCLQSMLLRSKVGSWKIFANFSVAQQ